MPEEDNELSMLRDSERLLRADDRRRNEALAALPQTPPRRPLIPGALAALQAARLENLRINSLGGGGVEPPNNAPAPATPPAPPTPSEPNSTPAAPPTPDTPSSVPGPAATPPAPPGPPKTVSTRRPAKTPSTEQLADERRRLAALRAARSSNARTSPRASSSQPEADRLNNLYSETNKHGGRFVSTMDQSPGSQGEAMNNIMNRRRQLAREAGLEGMKKGGPVKKMAKGGVVKSSASSRSDGCVTKGRTKGRMV